MQMLTEPMTAADRAQAKVEREAWDAMEQRLEWADVELGVVRAERNRAQQACEQMAQRIAELEAENIRLRSEVDLWKGRWEGAKEAVRLISE